MADKGFLLVTMQPPPAFEEEFNAWYDTEHLPERLAVPGFETALRFVCLSGHPRYLAMYDLAHPEVLDSPEYLQVAFDNSSPWTWRVLQRVRVYRSVGRQIYPGQRTHRDVRRACELLRFRNRPASAADEIVARHAREFRAATGDRAGARVHVRGSGASTFSASSSSARRAPSRSI